ncbi:hypothetical protein [Rhizobium sp. BK008]|uniref:hypothetical protein n=1 Tax=Rhizobium sp. BK008 TaxID=2587094 RepID=UPI00160CD9A3|nr:hypothetical protein [Rhizobium sp. BK008]MBB4255447.1 hypothetical protein [Rhizobium sp. BK008]
MAKTNFLSWSQTAANNTDIDGIGILGSNAVKNFDDALRTLMAQLRRDIDGKVVYTAKSGNYTLVADDNNGVFRFTAAATASLTAAATLATDWHATIIADGGDVTIDPNASETINGATTLIVKNGSTAEVICNGSNFFTSLRTQPLSWEPVGSQVTLAGQTSVSWTNLDVYRHLRLTLGYIPSPGSGNVLLRVSTDNGSSYISTSTYSSASLVQTGATVTGAAGAASTAMIVSSTGSDANTGFLSTIDISNFNKNAGASYKAISEYSNTNPRIDFIYGGHSGTTARNALQLLVSSGNFTSGLVLLEGLRG